jgi:hypothetical protein
VLAIRATDFMEVLSEQPDILPAGFAPYSPIVFEKQALFCKQIRLPSMVYEAHGWVMPVNAIPDGIMMLLEDEQYQGMHGTEGGTQTHAEQNTTRRPSGWRRTH